MYMYRYGGADRSAGVAAARDRLRSEGRSTTSMYMYTYSLLCCLGLNRTCTHAFVVRTLHLEETQVASPAGGCFGLT